MDRHRIRREPIRRWSAGTAAHRDAARHDACVGSAGGGGREAVADDAGGPVLLRRPRRPSSDHGRRPGVRPGQLEVVRRPGRRDLGHLREVRAERLWDDSGDPPVGRRGPVVLDPSASPRDPPGSAGYRVAWDGRRALPPHRLGPRAGRAARGHAGEQHPRHHRGFREPVAGDERWPDALRWFDIPTLYRPRRPHERRDEWESHPRPSATTSGCRP